MYLDTFKPSNSKGTAVGTVQSSPISDAKSEPTQGGGVLGAEGATQKVPLKHLSRQHVQLSVLFTNAQQQLCCIHWGDQKHAKSIAFDE